MTLDEDGDVAAQRDICLAELNALYEQIESSIQREDTDKLAQLIESRSAVLGRLEALIRKAPLSEAEQTRLLAREERLQKGFRDSLETFKKRLGDSRRRLSAISKYRKKGPSQS